MSHQVPESGFPGNEESRSVQTILLPGTHGETGENHAGNPEGMDLFGLLEALRRQWKIIVATVFAFLIVAGAWAWSQTPLYTATTEVLITPRQQTLIGGGLISPGLSSELMMIESQARIIVSEAVLRRVVKSEGLEDDPEFNGTRPARGFLAHLRALVGHDGDKVGESREEIALRILMKRLKVRRAEKTFVLEVSMTSEDPAKAARLANAIARAYIADQTESKATTAGKVNNLLAERLEILRRQLVEAERKVEDFKRSNDIVATGKDQIENEVRLKRLGEELEKARARAATARAREEKVRAALASGLIPEATDEVTRSPVIAQLRAEYARASARAASLAQSLGPRHPALQAARARADRIRGLIIDELTRIAHAAGAEAKSATGEVRNLEKALQEQKRIVERINRARVRLRELEREAAARRKVYEAFLLKSKESGEASKLQIPDARIISPALPPEYASWPKKKLILGLAGFLGLGFGIAFALLRDMSRTHSSKTGRTTPPNGGTRITTPEKRTELRHDAHASLPREANTRRLLHTDLHMPRLHADGEGPGAFLHEAHQALTDPDTAVRRAFRQAMERILDATTDWHVLAVTTPAHGHGGTTLAWALTIAAAGRGERILLVDADRDDPRLSEILLPPDAPKLEQALKGWIRPEKLVIHDPDNHIRFLPLATEDLRNVRKEQLETFRDWLKELFSRYDRVIIDAMPVSLPDGPLELSRLVDGVILSVGPEGADSEIIRKAASLVHDAGLPCSMVWNAGARRPGTADTVEERHKAAPRKRRERKESSSGGTMAEALR